MGQSTPEIKSSSVKNRLNVNFLVPLMMFCARITKKLNHRKQTHHDDFSDGSSEFDGGRERFGRYLKSSPLRSPRPKELLTTLGNKAKTIVGRKNSTFSGVIKPEKKSAAAMVKEEYGVWQKQILMGGKCEPLDFAGVIYYDCSGRQINELPPRSPRGISFPNYPTRSNVGSPLNPMGRKDF